MSPPTHPSHSEGRLSLLLLVAFLAAWGAAIAVWGLAGLTLFAILATLLVFVLLISVTRG